MKEVQLETLVPRWSGPCIVAATGESLTKKVAASCINSGYPIIAIKQAIRRFPNAPVMYSLDTWWWDLHQGCPEFKGEKWSGHCPGLSPKLEIAKKYGLRLILGQALPGFSINPNVIHWGSNTGFQAINMAIHWLIGPIKKIILVGFDMQGGYFFGLHPTRPGRPGHWPQWIPVYNEAAKQLPEGVEIINTSPISLLTCFPVMPLEEALRGN